MNPNTQRGLIGFAQVQTSGSRSGRKLVRGLRARRRAFYSELARAMTRIERSHTGPEVEDMIRAEADRLWQIWCPDEPFPRLHISPKR